MIEARKIKIENNILSLEYKINNSEYEKLEYDIKKEKIISLLEEELSDRKHYILYSHLIKPILNLHKEGKLEEKFVRMWC